MFIVFDIGGTNTRIGISEDGKTITDNTSFLTDAHNYEKNLEAFVTAVNALADGRPIQGMAGGIPGPLIEGGQGIGHAPNLPAWRGKLFAKDVSERIKTPVFLENDTAVIGIGEAVSGAGTGHGIVAYITVSTGVGGCRIVNGEIDENVRGFEPGHQVVDIDGPECACGGRGHLEALIGGASLERDHGTSPQEVDNVDVWDAAAKHLAVGLNNLLVMWSPDVFVVGGSVMKKISIEKAERYLHEIVTIYDKVPPVLPAKLEEGAGFLGGLAILRSKGM